MLHFYLSSGTLIMLRNESNSHYHFGVCVNFVTKVWRALKSNILLFLLSVVSLTTGKKSSSKVWCVTRKVTNTFTKSTLTLVNVYINLNLFPRVIEENKVYSVNKLP